MIDDRKDIHSTTILCVKKDGKMVMGGDSQTSAGWRVVRNNSVKVKKIAKGKALVGAAGKVADIDLLMEDLNKSISKKRNSVPLAMQDFKRKWNKDKHKRVYDACLLVADKSTIYSFTCGSMIKSENGFESIGSGGDYAIAAAAALIESKHSAKEIVEKALGIASKFCVFTNGNFVIEEL